MVYVYELRVGDRVIDVGVTNNLNNRLKQHTKKKPDNTGSGKYYGRTDITIHSISEWPTRKLAMIEEGKVKTLYGFEWTEQNWRKDKSGLSKGGSVTTSKYDTCPHCNQTKKIPIVYRWHFDNCKHNEQKLQRV